LIRSSAKVRAFGFAQYEPIASARSRSGSMVDAEELGACDCGWQIPHYAESVG